MPTKRELRIARAKAARALLGLEDDDGEQTQTKVEPAPAGIQRESSKRGKRDAAPQRKAGGDKQPRKADAAGPREADVGGPVPAGIRAKRGSAEQGASHDTPIAFIPESRWPKNHAPGSLPLNTPVWYKGERYYIEWSPPDWTRTVFVRISSKRLPVDRPGAQYACDGLLHIASIFVNGQNIMPAERESFCVAADVLTLAPVMTAKAELMGRSISHNQALAKARGDKDIGDPVALMLRDCKTLDDVYKVGAKFLSVKEDELRDRYGKLNPGQQRMNVGNKMRAHWRKQQRH